jgi:hypothetical protein
MSILNCLIVSLFWALMHIELFNSLLVLGTDEHIELWVIFLIDVKMLQDKIFLTLKSIETRSTYLSLTIQFMELRLDSLLVKGWMSIFNMLWIDLKIFRDEMFLTLKSIETGSTNISFTTEFMLLRDGWAYSICFE